MDVACRVIDLESCSLAAAMGTAARARARGFPMFMLCVNEQVRRPEGLQSAPVLTVCNNLDRGLVQDWSENRYAKDPFRRMSANGLLDKCRPGPLLWENDNGRISLPSAHLTSSETETMHLAYSHGVRTGVNVPLAVGGAAGRVIVSFFSTKPIAALGEIDDSLAILFYLAHAMYEALATRLDAERCGAGPRLTPRERECLAWVAKGKTATEMAVILGLSAATVRDHIKSLRTKLGASTRAEAIARAAALGQLGMA